MPLLLQLLLDVAYPLLLIVIPTSRQASNAQGLSLPPCRWLNVIKLSVLQGVWARMSDAVVTAWRMLDEDLHREEAESPFQLDKSVSHSLAGCVLPAHVASASSLLWCTLFTYTGRLPLG